MDKIDSRMDKIDSRMDKMDGRIEGIENKMDSLATKEDMSRIIDHIDSLFGKYEKQEQEMTFAGHEIKGIDGRVEVLEDDMQKVKPLVGLTS